MNVRADYEHFNWGYDVPLILIQRKVEFTCIVCGKPGIGGPLSKVHPGACKEERERQHVKKFERNRKKAKARLQPGDLPLRSRDFLMRAVESK